LFEAKLIRACNLGKATTCSECGIVHIMAGWHGSNRNILGSSGFDGLVMWGD
jgi:hypothetical protein